MTVRKPQTILPTGIPANAKQNYVVPTTQATMVIAETVTATATVGNPNVKLYNFFGFCHFLF